MNCCQCQGIESEFNRKYVEKDLKRYRKKGIGKTTRWLIEVLEKAGTKGLTLLDIGGGIGAIQHQLLQDGIRAASAVEISSAYLAAAREEAGRLGLDNRMRFYQGDFVDLAPSIPPADIVTLDRVICCYPDMSELVKLSAEKAGKFLALVYPHDTLPARMIRIISMFFFWLKRSPFRLYIHSSQAVHDQIRSNNFRQIFYRKTPIWQVVVYERLSKTHRI